MIYVTLYKSIQEFVTSMGEERAEEKRRRREERRRGYR
jgi:hypothetical protein